MISRLEEVETGDTSFLGVTIEKNRIRNLFFLLFKWRGGRRRTMDWKLCCFSSNSEPTQNKHINIPGVVGGCRISLSSSSSAGGHLHDKTEKK